MTENKTKPTSKNVSDYLNDIEDIVTRADCIKINQIMKDITGEEPVMWGESLIGYGKYHYKYSSGREGEWFITGFSPRKQNITIYLNYGFGENKSVMDQLGKYKTGKACLYIKKLDDVNEGVLRDLIKDTWIKVKKNSYV